MEGQLDFYFNCHHHVWPETRFLLRGGEQNNRKWEQICFIAVCRLLFALYIRTYSAVLTHRMSPVFFFYFDSWNTKMPLCGSGLLFGTRERKIPSHNTEFDTNPSQHIEAIYFAILFPHVILIQVPLKFVRIGPNDNETLCVEVTAWFTTNHYLNQW